MHAYYVSLQKDTTIRELTDRLFLGADKFQQYLTSPRRQNFARKTVAGRTMSQPRDGHQGEQRRPKLHRAFTEDALGGKADMTFENTLLPSGQSSPSYSVSVVDAGPAYYHPVSQEYPPQTLAVPSRHRGHSPNHDSAIENLTPSTSDSSERGSPSEAQRGPRGFRPPLLRAQTEPTSHEPPATPCASLPHVHLRDSTWSSGKPHHYSSVYSHKNSYHRGQLYSGSSIDHGSASQI
jgi:hypothetical protein